MPKLSGFQLYSFISAIGIIIGESWFVFTTDKYPPLWLDDYFCAVIMLIAVFQRNKSVGATLLLAGWAMVLGNLYAMTFTRLEPINPPDRPWALLAALTVWAFLSCVMAFIHTHRTLKKL